MALEIERKFLVVSDAWRRPDLAYRHIIDHLIARFEAEGGKARVRLCDDVALLTIKGPRRGYSRSEFHIPLDWQEAEIMVGELSRGAAIEKRRYEVYSNGLVWQVDEYLGALAGLVTCDVELISEGQPLMPPDWVGPDITGDSRFSSATLSELLETQDQSRIDMLLSYGGLS